MAKSQLIKIDGTDVTSYRQNSNTEDTIEDQSDKTILVFNRNFEDVFNVQSFQTLEIWEAYSGTLEQDSNRVFKGVISMVTKEPTKIIITGYGELWRAVQTEVNKTYDRNIDASAGKGSEIFKDLCDLANLSYDGTTVIDTGTVLLIDKFVCNKAEVLERMKVLAEIYGYQIWYNSRTDKIHFEPLGYITNTNTIYGSGTNANVTVLPTWSEDGTKLFNKIEIIGAYQEVQKTELFSGDTVEDTFTLEFVPEITDVLVSSVQQIGGVIGSTATYDYTVDKDQQQIIFKAGSIPGSGTDNISVTYSYRAPRPVILTNPTSITEIDRTIKQVFTFNDIQSIDDAENRGRDLLDVYSSPFISTKVILRPETTENFDIRAGQRIQVIDDKNGINAIMMIKKVNSKFPAGTVELELGDKTVRVGDLERDTTIRLKRLEEELAKSGTFIVEVVDIYNDVNVIRRYNWIDKRDTSTDTIWGRSIWGAKNWNNIYDNSMVKNFVSQGNDIYVEDFRDEDFKGDSVTATWDTSAKELIF